MMNKLCSIAVSLVLLTGLAGCRDVGPVGMYSKALFDKDVNLPAIEFSRYTVTYVSDGSGSVFPKQNYDARIVVTLKNTGGSSTLGYLQADLSMAAADGSPSVT